MITVHTIAYRGDDGAIEYLSVSASMASTSAILAVDGSADDVPRTELELSGADMGAALDAASMLAVTFRAVLGERVMSKDLVTL